MKISNTFKATSKIIVAAITLSVALVSCKKDDDSNPVQVSGLSVIHASPSAEKFDVFVDTKKANAADFSYTNKIDYLDVSSGNRKVVITKKGLTAPLLSDTMTLKPQVGYSLFVIDKTETLKYLLLKDDLSKPAAGKARVRFVNVSPDAPALNLVIAGSTTDLVTNKAFKGSSEFLSIDAAEKVTFNVKNQTGGAIVATTGDVKIEAGKIYTIWVKGLIAATDDTKLGVAVFTHK
ncbi:DUF4397 domain-containing protein [Flavihumibacter sp. R14]|nr:DUF4397 domain-containing protein [Flavihumibacter soli]